MAPPRRSTVVNNIAATLTLVINMFLTIPSVREATCADRMPAVTFLPLMIAIAAVHVARASVGGRTAAVPSPAKIAPTIAAVRVTPRRTSRARSISRPRSKRPRKDPKLQPVCCAASSRVLPSRQHSTNAVR